MRIYTYIFFFIVTVAEEISAQNVFTKQVSPVATGYKAVHFDSNIGYACGENGVIVKTNNDGGEWVKLTTGTVQPLWDIKIIPGTSGKSAIAVGENNTIIKTTDGGQTWNTQTIPFQAGSFVFGIQCFDSLSFIACGGDFATFSGALLRTSDGGNSWSKTAVPGSVFLDKIQMTSDTTGFAVGTNNTFSDGSIKRIAKSLLSSHAFGTTQLLTNLWMFNNQHIIVVGLNGQILKSEDGGNSWISKSINEIDLYAIHFLNLNTGFVAGGNTAGSVLLRTIDSGLSWEPVTTGYNDVIQAAYSSGKYLFLVGENGLILRSEHGVQTGLSDVNMDKDELDLRYNPNLKQIEFCGKNLTRINYSIYDMQGKVICSGNTFENTAVSLVQFNTGMFLIEFGFGTRRKFKKIIVI